MRKQIALGIALTVGIAGSAMAAEGFSYNNVEVSYTSLNLKGPTDADGFGLAGSYGFTDNLSAFAGYEDLDVDGGEGSIKRLNLGLGFNWALNPNLDLTSGLSYESLDVGPNASGLGLAVGLRGRLGESLELTAGAKYYDLNKGLDSQTKLTLGGRYYFTPNFAVGADFSDEDDFGKSWKLALRYDFAAE
jgi:hypothetical protein